MIRRSLLVFALFLGLTLVHVAVAHAAGTVKIGKPTFAPVSGTVIEAQSQVQFSVSGLFKPSDPDEEPWIRFVWNFGDGSPPVSSAMEFGPGVKTHVVNHSFDQAGIYTVTVTAGHGFDLFFGFRFKKTKTFKVEVACPGADIGPKKCAKGTFSPFTGTWDKVDGELPGATLVLEQVDKVVEGTLRYTGISGAPVVVPILEKVKYKRNKQGHQFLKLAFDHPYEVGTTKTKATGELSLIVDDDSFLAYRTIVLVLFQGQDTLVETIATFKLGDRTVDTTATLCNTLGAGKRTVSPGKDVVFAVAVANEGHASLPADRARLDLVVEGGTIDHTSSVFERAYVRGSDARTVNLGLAALGAGKGQANALSESFLVVTPDPGARVVQLTTQVFDDPLANDLPFVLQPPPVRRICVPVVE